MKPFLLKPESFDSISDILLRVERFGNTQVLIQLNKGQKTIQSQIDAQLLARGVKEKGKYLAVVTNDQNLTRLLKENHIHVFRSVEEANAGVWRWDKAFGFQPAQGQGERKTFAVLREQSTRLRQQKESNLSRWIAIFLAGLAVLTLLVVFIPSSTIHYSQTPLMQNAVLKLKSNAEITNPGVNGNVLMQQQMIQVTRKAQSATSGVEVLPGDTAICEVELYNLDSVDVTLPAGTKFSAAGKPDVSYSLVSEIDLAPAGEAAKTVVVTASQPGEIGNTESLTINEIESTWRSQVRVENSKACTSGTNLQTGIVLVEDVDKLREEIKHSSLQAVEDQLKSLYGDELFILGLGSTEIQVVEEQIQPAIGKPGQFVQLEQTLQIPAYFALKQDILKTIALTLDAGLMTEQEAVEGTLEFSQVSDPVELDGTYQWEVAAQQKYLQRIDIVKLREQLKGKLLEEAKAILAATPGLDGSVQITNFPTWMKRLSIVPFRIEFAHE